MISTDHRCGSVLIAYYLLFVDFAKCMYFHSRPKNNLQLLFVKTTLNFTVVFYVEFRSF